MSVYSQTAASDTAKYLPPAAGAPVPYRGTVPLGDAAPAPAAPARGKYLVAAGVAFAAGLGVFIWAASRKGGEHATGNAPTPIKPLKLKRIIPAR
jgi:hypothetical protein